MQRHRDGGPARPVEPPLAVVLVEALPLVRAGLRFIISDQPDMHVAVEAGSAEEAMDGLRRLRRRSRTVVVLSLGLPSGEAFRLIRAVREAHPTMPVLASKEFLDALRRAATGEIVLAGVPSDWVESIADGIEQHRKRPVPILTGREVEVLSVAAEGLTARQIGSRLGLRERTVTTHLCRIYGKLGVSGRTAALAAASSSGLMALAGSR